MAEDDRGALATLDAARVVFRKHIEAQGGRVVDTAGDSVLAAFETATGAVRAAVAVQRKLSTAAQGQRNAARLSFRIGVHLGDVLEKADGSVYGDGVNIAARLQAQCERGSVMVSQAVHGAVASRIRGDFDDAGELVVKNISHPVRAFRLRAEASRPPADLPAEIRPASSDGPALNEIAAEARQVGPLTNDVPLGGEPLLGRDDDRLALIGLLESNGLVTIVGAGGVGKTSLALVVARQVANRFTEGARWVDLAALSDPKLIVAAIAAISGVQLGESGDIPRLVKALATRSLLIVLDNCEHLAAELAPIVQALHAGAPFLKLLATSQQVLQVNGEHVYRLEALAVPEAHVSLSRARDFPAIALLERRAQARDQRFELNTATISQAIELCHSLDGLALAIEMAAARLPSLGFVALLSGLASLSSPSRVGPVRQKTLRATLEWSHRLLSDGERVVLRRLSAFSGAFELEAAQLVAASKDLDPLGVTEALAGLVDKSLVQVQRFVPPRYRLLQSMKEFASQQLAAAGEADSTLRLHGNGMAAIARRAEQSSWLLPEGEWIARYELDYSDLQAAFDRAVLLRDPEVAGATGEVLVMIENRRAVSGPQNRRINAAIALLDIADPLAKAHLWNCISPPTLSVAPRGMSRLEVASARLSAWRQIGDRDQIHVALGYLAIAQARTGDSAAASDSLAAMHALTDPTWPPRRMWEGPWRSAHVREFQGDAAGCVEARRQGLAIAESAGDESLAELSRMGLAEAHLLLGDHAAALELLPALLDRLRKRNDTFRLTWALDLLCAALLLSGEVERASTPALEMLAKHRQLDTAGWASIILALLATKTSRYAEAGKLLGYSDNWFKSREIVPEPIFQRISRVVTGELDTAIGISERRGVCTEGSALSQVVADALADALVR
jgi:predicted ATPase